MVVMIVRPARAVNGRLEMPGDKSISHRAAILASLAEGATAITNFAPGDDCRRTLECLAALGAEIEQRPEGIVRVHGRGFHRLREPSGPLDCGNSGTTMRLMAGLLAGAGFGSLLVGDDSLSSRPMARVIEPLAEMGARINQLGGGLQIHASEQLHGIRYRMPVASAQVKSAVLIAALHSEGSTEVIEPVRTRDHTERLFEYLGVSVSFDQGPSGDLFITVQGGARLAARDLSVPGDISSAAYFVAAAAMLPGSRLTLRDVGLNPTRTQFIRLLQNAGIDIGISGRSVSHEPVGDLNITADTEYRRAEPFVIDGPDVAGLIDELPILAVLSTQFAGMRLRGASELRAKESDRITSVVENLTRMGAQIEECEDGFDVGPSKLKGADLDTFGDHRIAMAFAIAALAADGPSHIRDAEACAVSFPGFFDALESIAVR